MALISINADLTRTADALERIAEALERISPPVRAEDLEPRAIRRTEPQDIGRTTGGERAAVARLHALERTLDQDARR